MAEEKEGKKVKLMSKITRIKKDIKDMLEYLLSEKEARILLCDDQEEFRTRFKDDHGKSYNITSVKKITEVKNKINKIFPEDLILIDLYHPAFDRKEIMMFIESHEDIDQEKDCDEITNINKSIIKLDKELESKEIGNLINSLASLNQDKNLTKIEEFVESLRKLKNAIDELGKLKNQIEDTRSAFKDTLSPKGIGSLEILRNNYSTARVPIAIYTQNGLSLLEDDDISKVQALEGHWFLKNDKDEAKENKRIELILSGARNKRKAACINKWAVRILTAWVGWLLAVKSMDNIDWNLVIIALITSIFVDFFIERLIESTSTVKVP